MRRKLARIMIIIHIYIIPSLEFLKFLLFFSLFCIVFFLTASLAIIYTSLISSPFQLHEKHGVCFFKQKKPKDVGDGEGEDDRLSSLQLRGFSRFSRSSSTLGLRRSGSTLRPSSSRRTSNKARVPWLQMVNLMKITRKKLTLLLKWF